MSFTEVASGKRRRFSFAKIEEREPVPYLLDVQLRSYAEFLQLGIEPSKRKRSGLQAVFIDTFPITDFNNNFSLEFVSYSLGEPKNDMEDCKNKGMTYSAPLKATLRLHINEKTEDGAVRPERIKEKQDVFLCEFPLMTETGTFIINGAERVIVSQLHRSPGVIFDDDGGKRYGINRKLLRARLIPYRGSWLEFEFDSSNVLYAQIDRKRKFLATTLFRALGIEDNEAILEEFFDLEKVTLKAAVERVSAKDLIDSETGEVLLLSGEVITEVKADEIKALGGTAIKELTVLKVGDVNINMLATLTKDKMAGKESSVLEIYAKMRPGDPPKIESAELFLNNLFFNPRRYDLGKIGRYKLNTRLKLAIDQEKTTLTQEDILAAVKKLYEIANKAGKKDDIDHLGNRRVRASGELIENCVRKGLARMERVVRERMSILSMEDIMPNDLINTKPVSAAINEFFGSSQLSQFMDQTNPLAELTHKRRLSALGPGGLNRDRAGFEVRDVHYTHYGRLCPIETPEGPNIGLITSLATYARINEYGFIETPLRVVKKRALQPTVDYLSADQTDQHHIAQANALVDGRNRLSEDNLAGRYRDDIPVVAAEDIDYIDISPKQIVSVAAALIPFLEHDDTSRALMGSNMQRQAVPLLISEAPLVGTGMEDKVAYDSGAVIRAKHAGVVEEVTADRITIVTDARKEIGVDNYHLVKFQRSNQDTCINQRPIVEKGERVRAGDPIADGPSTNQGELALGRNLLVAFMPWRGYNFEDAIVISERVVREDIFTSVHIEEMQVEARDTKLGKEEITRDIPNQGEESLKTLDEDGIIRVGSEVEPGTIVVGKITPKGETDLTPEEKLLRAIFGEKAGDVKDTSLRTPPGLEGKVIAVNVFKRREREEELSEREKVKLKDLERERARQIRRIERQVVKRTEQVKQECKEALAKAPRGKKGEMKEALKHDIELLKKLKKERIDKIKSNKHKQIDKIKHGDELAPGVIKLVKVYIAKRRKLSVGDKMAGRHGNKGVVARILPEEDLPYMEDGTPIDIVLNPLGVPSRMNVGQILEAMLGWVMKEHNGYAITPVFAGATEQEIRENLKELGKPEDGQVVLRDGVSGRTFDQKVSVGYFYMLKLAHLVDDKMHARSIGPYSLITQQPLGGKAQFGGQRFGEMEVWALEAYGAAYTLQELLTVKSDDVNGRNYVYEALVKGKNTPEPGLPESFNVLVKELQGLGLNVELLSEKDKDKEKTKNPAKGGS